MAGRDGTPVNALYTGEQILPSDIAHTEQIVAEVNDRRLCGKPALKFVQSTN